MQADRRGRERGGVKGDKTNRTIEGGASTPTTFVAQDAIPVFPLIAVFAGILAKTNESTAPAAATRPESEAREKRDQRVEFPLWRSTPAYLHAVDPGLAGWKSHRVSVTSNLHGPSHLVYTATTAGDRSHKQANISATCIRSLAFSGSVRPDRWEARLIFS